MEEKQSEEEKEEAYALTKKEASDLFPQQKSILTEFKRELVLKNNSETTRRIYVYYAKKFLQSTPIKRPRESTDEDVKSFLAKETQGNAVCRAALKAFFKLDEVDLKYPNITGRSSPYRDFCSREYYERAVSLVDNRDDRLMVKVAYVLALRNSETVNTKCKDWHFVGKTVDVRGKGSKIRTIPVPESLMLEVRDHMGFFKISAEHDDFLFPFIQCYKQPEQHFRDVLRNIGNKLGEYHSPHSYRRGRADELRQLGSDALDLKELLGHSSVGTTEIYMRGSGKKIREMLEKTEK